VSHNSIGYLPLYAACTKMAFYEVMALPGVISRALLGKSN